MKMSDINVQEPAEKAIAYVKNDPSRLQELLGNTDLQKRIILLRGKVRR